MRRRSIYSTAVIISFAIHATVFAVSGISLLMDKTGSSINTTQETDPAMKNMKTVKLPVLSFNLGYEKKKMKGDDSVIDEIKKTGDKKVQNSSGQDESNILRYNEAVKELINKSKKYPASAKKRMMEGIVHISFIVGSNGRLSSITLLKTSGYDILDKAAIDTIRNSSPFPAFGSYIKLPELEMNIVLVYRL